MSRRSVPIRTKPTNWPFGVHTHSQSHRSTASAAGPGGTGARGARAVELDGGSVTVCHINESPPLGLSSGCDGGPGVTRPFSSVSRLGTREREHHDLSLAACDVDLVAIHEDCTSDLTYQINANLLHDGA